MTVVIPTIHNAPEELRTSLETTLACEPYEMIMITTQDKYNAPKELVVSLSHDNIRVLCADIANKRLQLCKALPEVTTNIIIMADDDVWWLERLIHIILTPFEDPKMGGSAPARKYAEILMGRGQTRSGTGLARLTSSDATSRSRLSTT